MITSHADHVGSLLRPPELLRAQEDVAVDAPHYPLLLDPETRAFYEGQGWTLDEYLHRGIEMDNAIIGHYPDVTFGFHL